MEKKSQIWVETAIYTLIGLAVIAIVMSAALPQIDKMKDRSVIRQTVTALEIIDTKIIEAEQSALNLRVAKVKISKGRLEVNSSNDKLIYILDNSRLKVSEPGITINEGGIEILTTQVGSRYRITLIKDYTGKINITFDDSDEKIKTLQPTNALYNVYIENKGDNAITDPTHIDMRVD